MTGPEHYRQAEKLIAMYEGNGPEWAAEWGMHALVSAQANATLALAAAVFRAGVEKPYIGTTDEMQAWREAIS